jgi:hypothetical protein
VRKDIYAVQYGPAELDVASFVLANLLSESAIDFVEIEWVEDVDRFEQGVDEMPIGIRSRFASSRISLSSISPGTPEFEWATKYTPSSFCAQFYNLEDGSRVEVNDASAVEASGRRGQTFPTEQSIASMRYSGLKFSHAERVSLLERLFARFGRRSSQDGA